MIAGLHTKQSELQTKEIPCVVCGLPIFYSAMEVDKDGNIVAEQKHDKAIAFECLMVLLTVYGEHLAKYTAYLTVAQKEQLATIQRNVKAITANSK